MKFWAAVEGYQPVYSSVTMARRAVESYLNTAFSASSLAALDCELRYVPIIMPTDMAVRYPARSKLRKKQRLYDCAPQLNYDVFVDGTWEEQLREYIGGIRPSAPYLAALGASPGQIGEFKAILDRAFHELSATEPDIKIPRDPFISMMDRNRN